ncbi:MAG TPA: DUF6599 family protein [Candidatus Acidoferrales bacterium]|nr:DUF6599 family protein [Candidatus Acidoferrales bacterium]
MRGWLWLIFLALAARPAAAQSLLPAGGFAGWQPVPGSALLKATLEQLDPADAALLRACHEQTGERVSYQRDGAALTVTVYWMGDPSYAYSAYSFLRPAPATDFRPTPHATVGAERAMFLVGNLLVDVGGQDLPADGAALSALAAALKPHASDEPYPTLWQYVPTDRLIAHTDRYALDPQTLAWALEEAGARTAPAGGASQWPAGDWLGFDDSVEAEVARYDLRGREVTLVLASYPTQQLAAEHLNRMAQWPGFTPQPGAGPGPARLAVFSQRYGSFVGLVAGAADAAEARGLLGQIHYQTEVTWNAPGFELKDLTMPQYVVGIILGTISIIVITLVAGVALGMVRIATKRYLPGLVFDRHHSMEILQLGLSSKPIDFRDFYGL